MVALEAELTLSRKGSRRTVPADQFFTGIFSTALEPEELLTDIRVPGLPPRTGGAFRRDCAARRRFRARRCRSARHAQRRRPCRPCPARPVWRRSHAHPRARGGAGADRRVAGGARARRRRREDGGGDRSAERHPCLRRPSARSSRVTWDARRSSWRRVAQEVRHEAVGQRRSGSRSTASATSSRSSRADCSSTVLREDLGLTGTHIGCEHGVCGTCTVLVDGETVRSCLMLAVQARRRRDHHGRGPERRRRPASAAAGVPRGAGAAVRVLHAGHADDRAASCCATIPSPSEADIREAISANLCRCTGYQGIVDAPCGLAAGSAARWPALRPQPAR